MKASRWVIILVLQALFLSLGSNADSAPDMPTPLSPAMGATLTDFTTTLQWRNPGGTTQIHLEVVPANNDGPGVNLILGATESLTLPPPPQWYGFLPDMTYSWRVRASNAPSSVPLNDTSWGNWTTVWTFRTPKIFNTVFPINPRDGAVVGSKPVIQWGNGDNRIYYYEFQLSTDKNFDTNPDTAIASVTYLLRHGAVTNPVNSYVIPDSMVDGVTYYWRVRPRVQGDGKPLEWSSPWSFTKLSNPDLIQNGNFEGQGGWSDNCFCIIGLSITGGWHSGSKGAFLLPTKGEKSATVSQEIVIPAGVQNSTLTYWYQLKGSDSSYSDCFFAGVWEELAALAIVGRCVFQGYVNGWTSGSIDLSNFSGKRVLVRFTMSTEYAFTHKNFALLDDVAVLVK